jgi:predicted ATPase
LLTLTGPGGSGKTRLAVEAAARLREPYHGAVWFVSLAEVREPQRLPGAVADALGIDRAPGMALVDQMAAALDGRPSLLVLDNFEQLLGPADQDRLDSLGLVEALLAGAPALALMVTSRQRLGLAGEQELPVPPLPHPHDAGARDCAGTAADFLVPSADTLHLMDSPSVQLFVDRAQAVRPDFALTPRNAAGVAALCALLDGIPLAIELAASWSSVLTPRQMLARLHEGGNTPRPPSDASLGDLHGRFDLLVARQRGRLPRHRSLRAALDWSYELLPAPLQRFYAQLSGFRGGWTLEAAEAVCKDEGGRMPQSLGQVAGLGTPDEAPDPDRIHPSSFRLHPSDVLDLLTSLVERSLVVADEESEGMRYRMLETVREHASEYLCEEENRELRRRHATYFRQLAEEADRQLRGPEQAGYVARLEREYPNLLAALGHSSSDTGIRLAGALGQFWQITGRFEEGSGWLDRALAACPATPADREADRVPRARALCAAAALARIRGESACERALVEDGLQLARMLPDPSAVAHALRPLTNPDFLLPNLRVDRGLPDRFAILGAAEPPEARALRLGYRGHLAMERGEYATADSLYDESLRLYRDLNDRHGAAVMLWLRGNTAIYRGDYGAARRSWEESLAVYRQIGNRAGSISVVGSLCYLATRQSRFAEATSLCQEVFAFNQKSGSRIGLASSMWGMANIARLQGHYDRAEQLLAESLAISRAIGHRSGVADAITSLGAVALCRGDTGGARCLQEEALAMRREAGDKLDIALNLHRLGQAALAEEDHQEAARCFAEALALGREMESRYGVAVALHGLGLTAVRKGDAGAAAESLGQAHALFEELEDRRCVAECLEGLAELRQLKRRPHEAARFLGQAEALREAIGAPMPPVDRTRHARLVADLRRQLGGERFMVAWNAGRGMIESLPVDATTRGRLPND